MGVSQQGCRDDIELEHGVKIRTCLVTILISTCGEHCDVSAHCDHVRPQIVIAVRDVLRKACLRQNQNLQTYNKMSNFPTQLHLCNLLLLQGGFVVNKSCNGS